MGKPRRVTFYLPPNVNFGYYVEGVLEVHLRNRKVPRVLQHVRPFAGSVDHDFGASLYRDTKLVGLE